MQRQSVNGEDHLVWKNFGTKQAVKEEGSFCRVGVVSVLEEPIGMFGTSIFELSCRETGIPSAVKLGEWPFCSCIIVSFSFLVISSRRWRLRWRVVAFWK